jgi:hypothetical protein
MSEIENNELANSSKNSIRLSQLNPELKDRFQKFDTGNDGELSIEEALQGLVTLQKQSNNYKKILYLFSPILLISLACFFGMNILAINLTKDIKYSTSQDVNYLVNKNGDSIKVESYSQNLNFIDLLSTSSIEELFSVTKLQFGGYDDVPLLNLPVNSIIVEGINNDTTTIIVSTPYILFKLSSDSSYSVEYTNNIQDTYSIYVFHIVSQSLNHISISIENSVNQMSKVAKNSNVKVIITVLHDDNKPKTRGIGGFGCSKSRCFG